MKSFKALLPFAIVFAAVAPLGAAERDTEPPTITITSPEAGVRQKTNEIVVSGTAEDTAQAASATGGTVNTPGVRAVEYKLKGGKWHRATLTASGESSTTWVFTIKLSKGKSTYVSVRSIDRDGNESDTITRKVQRENFTRKFQNP